MRRYRCVALFATVVAVCTLTALLPRPDRVRAAESQPSDSSPCTCAPDRDSTPKIDARPKLAELQQRLDEDDEIAALEAIRIALTEIGDGSTFVWRRSNGRISGVVKPTSSFKDSSGKVCRHLVLVLAAGTRTGKIEGIACRLENGRWELDG